MFQVANHDSYTAYTPVMLSALEAWIPRLLNLVDIDVCRSNTCGAEAGQSQAGQDQHKDWWSGAAMGRPHGPTITEQTRGQTAVPNCCKFM